MSKEYEGQDPIAIAQQAERDLNSTAAKQGSSLETGTVNSNNTRGASDSSMSFSITNTIHDKSTDATTQQSTLA
jgi:hypothetical protein